VLSKKTKSLRQILIAFSAQKKFSGEAQVAQGGPKYFQGGTCPPAPYFPRLWITIRYYPALFAISGIRPDNDSYPARYWIITKLDLLGKMIGKEKIGRAI